MKTLFRNFMFMLLGLLFAASSSAGEVTIHKVVMEKTGDAWMFSVTIQHDDKGWKHYADGWRVLDAKGKVIKMRTLFHPHDKNPFTRSLGGVVIPAGAKSVSVEAHDKVHGWSKNKVVIDLSKNKGDKYTIRR